MATCGAGYSVRKAAVYKHGTYQHAFGHCGTRAVKPKERYFKLPCRKVGRYYLVQQISAKQYVHLHRREAALFKGRTHRMFKHFSFGLFPCTLAPGVVLKGNVEIAAEQAFRFHVANYRSARNYARRVGKENG